MIGTYTRRLGRVINRVLNADLAITLSCGRIRVFDRLLWRHAGLVIGRRLRDDLSVESGSPVRGRYLARLRRWCFRTRASWYEIVEFRQGRLQLLAPFTQRLERI